jgi:glycosyltransferase involved in cell wall biosynthesis
MGIVVISAALRADLLAAIAGLPANRTFVAHDAADPPCAQDKVAQLNWPARAGALQVGYVGHLYPGKGMEMISNLAEQLPGIDFHVIGGTEQYIAFWRSQVSASNLHFHGFVEHSKLSAYYDRLDVCLAPLQRRIEGEAGGDIARWTSPLKIFEYMSTGKAIVASDIAVLREVLTHEVNALLAPPDDRDAWARALLRLQADPQLRSTLAETANRAFRAQHTWRGRAQQILNWCLPGNPRHSTGSLPIGARSMDVSDTKSVQRS